MKLWIPALLLLSVFVGATLWQSLWTKGLRKERDRAWELAELGPQAPDAMAPIDRRRGSDQARILVGVPSGAAPLPVPEPAPAPRRRLLQGRKPDPQGTDDLGPEDEAAAFDDVEPDFTMVVRGGQSLSVICQQHYETARPDLVRALAAYNGLADADAIRVGQTLYLPAIRRLQE